MTFRGLIKQPWFQILVGAVVLIALVLGIYYYGKSQGRKANATEFDARQAETLRKAQDSLSLADRALARAEASERLADDMQRALTADRAEALRIQQAAEVEHDRRLKEINGKYEMDKSFINDPNTSGCARCRDICQRTNRAADAYPDLGLARCNTSSCDQACSP